MNKIPDIILENFMLNHFRGYEILIPIRQKYKQTQHMQVITEDSIPEYHPSVVAVYRISNQLSTAGNEVYIYTFDGVEIR